jgi:hypothetical protein
MTAWNKVVIFSVESTLFQTRKMDIWWRTIFYYDGGEPSSFMMTDNLLTDLLTVLYQEDAINNKFN